MRIINNAAAYANYASDTWTLTEDPVPGRAPLGSYLAAGDKYTLHISAGGDWEICQVTTDGITITRDATEASSGAGGISPIEFVGTCTLTVVVSARNLALINGAAATASADYSIAMGQDAAASESDTIAVGRNAQAHHAGAIALGRDSLAWNPYIESLWQSWRWSGNASTTNATPTRLAAPGATEIVIPEYAVLNIRAQVVAQRDDGAAYSAEIVACIRRGDASAEIVGTPTVTVVGASAGVTATATVVIAGTATVRIQVTGAAGQSWWWSGHVIGVQNGAV